MLFVDQGNSLGDSEEPPLWFIFDEKIDTKDQKLLDEVQKFNVKIDFEPLGKGAIRIPPKMMLLHLSAEDFKDPNGHQLLTERLIPFISQNPNHAILVEGFHLFKQKKQELIASILPELILTYNTGLIPTRNAADTAQCLRSIARREQIRDNPPTLGRVKAKAKTLQDAQEILIEGLIQCGPNKSKLLLNQFDCPNDIFESLINHPENIEAIKGFGKKFIKSNQDLLQKNFNLK
jgi:hypothetical protein